MPPDGPPQPGSSGPDNNVVETIQSLIVAFVLAMTFRGFVTEGFVIPTGSMAPTLLGQHMLVHSEQTGIRFPVGMDQQADPKRVNTNRIADPMLGPAFPGSGVPSIKRPMGMGDRILVLKCLYPFAEPKRFDVVVFKNPTDPTGDAANYIKRLVGLPNEQVWLTDGDVFARPSKATEFQIQRKPEHVQRAVWQMVHQSDYVPMQPQRLDRRYDGAPWVGSPAWDTTGRSFVCTGSEPTTLTWDNGRRPLNDWAAYNMFTSPMSGYFPVSDLRVSAGIVAGQPGLKTVLELETRSHLFQFIINTGADAQATVTLRMRPLTSENGGSEWTSHDGKVNLPAPGKVFNVEFWHVDQSMQLFIDGKPALEPLNYDWSPMQRLQFATGELENEDVDKLIARLPRQPQIRWRFEGSPVTLHRVRVDRDLFYRPDILAPERQQQRNEPHKSGHAFATHPTDNPGTLGPDQFMMCGDNSPMSLDSRLWGSPHPLVASQIDPTPFVVNRKLLLGKAWLVYFPAPYALTQDGTSFIPDFGRLRFIR